MLLPAIFQSNSAKAAAATTALATAREAADPNVLNVTPWVYSAIAVALALAGVYLARLVTIDAENKKLGRVQTFRETGPLTWIGVLIVGPMIWHYKVAIPWAPIIGLGVGYSVRAMLKVFGGGAVASAKAMLRGAAGALDDDVPGQPKMDAPGARPPSVVLPANSPTPEIDKLVDRLDGE